MARQATQFDGKKALIVGKKHPHEGKTAVCVGADVAKIINKPALIFKDSDDHEFFVFEPKDIQWI